MKKKLLSTILALLSVVSFTHARTIINGITYNLDSTTHTAEVAGVMYGGSYSGSIVIPSSVSDNGDVYSVTSIGMSAFRNCSDLTSIDIPNSVTSIGNSAFYGCTGLISVDIPNSVTSIGIGAFQGCSGLISVDIPNSVTSIDYNAFYGCSGLTSVTIPNSVTSIYGHAFCGCRGLKSVTIPNSVTSIGGSAFSGCSGLASVIIPSSVTSIGRYAFNSCSGLTSIKVESGNTVYDSRDNCNAIIETSSNTLIQGCKNTTIPYDVTSIGANAFSGCSGLTSIDIPNSVTLIDVCAFQGCSGLISIDIPNSVTSIHGSAFSGCSGLTDVTIGNSVTLIDASAFFGCSGLTSITIPQSVTGIGIFAFANCPELASINVEIGNTVYDSRNNCNAIIETQTNTLIQGCKTTSIPHSVTNIGNYAFSGCSGLTSITIPNSVTSIGMGAFDRCPNLSEIMSYIKQPYTIDYDVFLSESVDIKSKATLYVLEGTKDLYLATAGWEFSNIVEIKEIMQWNFNNDKDLNIDDVEMLRKCIQDNDFTVISKDAADVNGDGDVNITDIVTLILMINAK